MQLDTGNIVTDLQRWMTKFIEEKTNKGVKQRTLDIYNGILENFLEYSRQYQGEAGIDDINRIFVNGYLADRAKNSTSFGSSTKNLHITVLKSLFAFITENNDSNEDFDKYFKKLKATVNVAMKPRVEEDELTKLLNYLQKMKSEPRNRTINFRNSLLVKSMLYAGLREIELIPLKLTDFVFHDKTDKSDSFYSLMVTGKGGKERMVYMPASTISDELETLKEKMGENWQICLTRNGTIINRSNLWTIVAGIFKRAGVEKTGLHILRHTFARRMVDANINLETIRELLGHADIATTSKFYAKTNEQNKRNAVLNLHKDDKQR